LCGRVAEGKDLERSSVVRKKTKQVVEFLDGMHDYIRKSPLLRSDTSKKTEARMQAEIRPIIINFLTKYFRKLGYKDDEAKAHASFYWEGQEGSFGRKRAMTFGARNYPDFIIKEPYLVAIEYKKSASGGLIKQGIGQSIMHTLSGDFDFVYFLFHDQNKDKRIEKSVKKKKGKEKRIVDLMWNTFNVRIKVI
jgi:hypothetical protein